MTFRTLAATKLRANTVAAEMDEDTMWRLQDLREAYGKPMRITSGYRCPDHPIEAGKTKLARTHQGVL